MPSRGRPQNIERFFSQPMTTEGIVAIDDDEKELYSSVRPNSRWQIVSTPPSRFGPKSNEIFNMFPGRKWYGTINDDMMPESPGWDSFLINQAGERGIAYADDCLGKRAGCVAFGGKFLRAVGWICCPGIQHFYNDCVHELFIKEFGGKLCSNIKIPHLHFSNGAKFDETYRNRPSIKADEARFNEWQKNEWPTLRGRLKAILP